MGLVGGGGEAEPGVIRSSYIRARRLGGLRKKGARVEAERQVKERFQAEAARMRAYLFDGSDEKDV